MSKVNIVIGSQWGDEGKGKWIDVLAKDADLVVRYQGGNNAGHTIFVDGEKVVLHQLPSGVFHGKVSSLAAGVVIDPLGLLQEIEDTSKRVPVGAENLWISGRAHIITPWHVHRDSQQETETTNPIGTTRRGIGPTYSDKAARFGLRLGHFVRDRQRQNWFDAMAADPERGDEFLAHRKEHQNKWEEFERAASRLLPYCCDAETRIRKWVREGQRVLLEGAQGVLLDLDHGTYPFVTSSSTGAGGALQSIGLPPKCVNKVIGIAKAYVTRVGTGPMPTELTDDVGKHLADKGSEFGATTGRPRRCGWLDAVALRYAVSANGMDAIMLNKMDILSGLPEIKMCVAYKHPEFGEINNMPWDSQVLEECEPVYETFAGFNERLKPNSSLTDLPSSVRTYVAAIEAAIGTNVAMIGIGPNPEDFAKVRSLDL
jgi:adenylosuccinate synthase